MSFQEIQYRLETFRVGGVTQSFVGSIAAVSAVFDRD